MTEDDSRAEEYHAQLYEEMSGQAVAEFAGERLVSFYKANPTIAQKPLNLLSESRALLNSSYLSAALIHAFITIEVLIKEVFGRPLITGAIHHEGLADIIVQMAFAAKHLDPYTVFTQKVFSEIAGIDLTQHKRATATVNILEEVKALQKKRNCVIHRGETVTKHEAETAIAVAAEIMGVLFVALAKKLGFHVHEDYKLCTDSSCQWPQRMRDIMKLGGTSPVLLNSPLSSPAN